MLQLASGFNGYISVSINLNSISGELNNSIYNASKKLAALDQQYDEYFSTAFQNIKKIEQEKLEYATSLITSYAQCKDDLLQYILSTGINTGK